MPFIVGTSGARGVKPCDHSAPPAPAPSWGGGGSTMGPCALCGALCPASELCTGCSRFICYAHRPAGWGAPAVACNPRDAVCWQSWRPRPFGSRVVCKFDGRLCGGP